jgi:hypothetical protein
MVARWFLSSWARRTKAWPKKFKCAALKLRPSFAASALEIDVVNSRVLSVPFPTIRPPPFQPSSCALAKPLYGSIQLCGILVREEAFTASLYDVGVGFKDEQIIVEEVTIA